MSESAGDCGVRRCVKVEEERSQRRRLFGAVGIRHAQLHRRRGVHGIGNPSR